MFFFPISSILFSLPTQVHDISFLRLLQQIPKGLPSSKLALIYSLQHIVNHSVLLKILQCFQMESEGGGENTCNTQPIPRLLLLLFRPLSLQHLLTSQGY